ncbi:hypothetical protein AB0C93_17245 [Streptomyces sp. NPDC048518]|uniref:hypothetical protein n=1 Tax=Streptomyces sp. NPDC048518 TaxID=3155029 RepID=UPI00340EEDE3
MPESVAKPWPHGSPRFALSSLHGEHQEAREEGRLRDLPSPLAPRRTRGAWEDEKFGDEDSADQFRKLVEAHGNQWPHGRIKGRGFVEPETHPDDHPFGSYAHAYVDALNTVDDRTKHDYRRDIERHFLGVKHTGATGKECRLGGLVHTAADGAEHPPTICNVTQADVNEWVRRQRHAVPSP